MPGTILVDALSQDWKGRALRAEAEIERQREALKKCRFRLFGAGPSTDPLYAVIRDALGE